MSGEQWAVNDEVIASLLVRVQGAGKPNEYLRITRFRFTVAR
jgi:hypothetical protein